MTEKQVGEQKATKTKQANALSDAVKLVNAEIDSAEKYLERIVKTEDAELVSVDGKTFAGFDVTVWANSSQIAATMLEHNFHWWNTLELDAPDAMWEEIAELVGLDTVYFVDIPLPSTAEEITNTKTD